MERIGNDCFYDSRIEEVTLPNALKQLGSDVFRMCSFLKTIYVEDGCKASLVNAWVPDSTGVILLSMVMVGGVSV